MKKYEKYKSSGINWIGEIPLHWKTARIKNLFYQASTKSKELTANTYIPLENIQSFTGKLLATASNENGEETILFKRDDILFNKLRPYLGKIIFAEFNGGVSGEVIVFRLYNIHKNNSFKKFFFYRMLSSQFIFKVNSMTDGVKMPRTNPVKISCLDVAVPTYSEQVLIASYLDQKTSAIDKKVSLLEQKITHYQQLRKSLINQTVCRGLDKNVKLKESGIEWIGMIPEHWVIKRLKDEYTVFTGNSISDKSLFENKNDSLDYVSTKDIDIETGQITYDNGVYIPMKDKSFKIAKANSILLCIEGGSAGKKVGFNTKDICFVNKLCSFKGKTKNVNEKYQFYSIQSPIFERQFFAILNGLIGGVSLNLIKFFNILYPPISEQSAIATYLDEKTQKIDLIITNITTQIATLKELRKTLINDVVTGKLKVKTDI